MKTGHAAVFALAAVMLAGCPNNSIPDPYRKQGKQNPAGTPSDRTGGAKNTADGAGGGPQKPQPADEKPKPGERK